MHQRIQADLTRLRQRPFSRRTVLFLIPLFILFVMGLYAITDIDYLYHDHALTRADWMGYAVCHRITERSFMINGRQFPLCARCTGMYLGAALTLLTLGLAGRWRWSDLPPLKLLLVLLGLIGIMGIDGINSYLHFFPNAPHVYQPQNWLRLTTGMGTGLAMGLIMWPALAQTLWANAEFRPIISSWRELAGFVALLLVGIFLLLSNQALLLYVLAIVSIFGLLGILLSINLVLGLILLHRDGRALTWRETAVPLLIGLTLAIIELSLISTIRLSITGTMTGFPGL